MTRRKKRSPSPDSGELVGYGGQRDHRGRFRPQLSRDFGRLPPPPHGKQVEADRHALARTIHAEEERRAEAFHDTNANVSMSMDQDGDEPDHSQQPTAQRHGERRQRCHDRWRAQQERLLHGFLRTQPAHSDPRPAIIKTCPCGEGGARVSWRKTLTVGLLQTSVLFAQTCSQHQLDLILDMHFFPASVDRPAFAFSFDILDLYQHLWDRLGLAIQAFVGALTGLHDKRFKGRRSTDLASQKGLREAFSDAQAWYALIKRRVDHYTSGFIDRLDSRPPDGHTLQSLAHACPACFGNLPSSSDTSSLDLVVCLDGNFQHKRRKRADACSSRAESHRVLLPRSEVEAVQKEVDEARGSDKAQAGCLSDFKAANEGYTKATLNRYDVTGLMMLSCRHDVPLFACDIFTPGEGHFYSIALLKALLRVVGPHVSRIGVLYDIACTVSKGIAKHKLLGDAADKLSWATSIFHSYGHDYGCQVLFGPRHNPSFGFSDGEGNERIWSLLANIVGKERSMGAVRRHTVLEERLASIAKAKRASLAAFLARRLKYTQQTLSAGAAVLAKCQPMLERERASLQALTASVGHGGDDALLGGGIHSATPFAALLHALCQWRRQEERQYGAAKATLAEVEALTLKEKAVIRRLGDLERLRCRPTPSAAAITKAERGLAAARMEVEEAKQPVQPSLWQASWDARRAAMKVEKARHDLRTALSHWKAESEKLRVNASNPNGTSTHVAILSSLQSRASAAKRLRNTYNQAIGSAALSSLCLNLESIREEDLFLQSTLAELHVASPFARERAAPWRFNKELRAAMDAAETVTASEEEVVRLEREGKSLVEWLHLERRRLRAGADRDPRLRYLWEWAWWRLDKVQRQWMKDWPTPERCSLWDWKPSWPDRRVSMASLQPGNIGDEEEEELEANIPEDSDNEGADSGMDNDQEEQAAALAEEEEWVEAATREAPE